MKRKEFLKLFAASTAVVAVAPMALVKETEQNKKSIVRMGNRHDFLKQHPLTTEEAYQETGRLHWKSNRILRLTHELPNNQIQTFREAYKIK